MTTRSPASPRLLGTLCIVCIVVLGTDLGKVILLVLIVIPDVLEVGTFVSLVPLLVSTLCSCNRSLVSMCMGYRIPGSGVVVLTIASLRVLVGTSTGVPRYLRYSCS